ncbi:MAG: hypothetical protein ACRDRF_06145 [Pseudonocardiaceae bacterium]
MLPMIAAALKRVREARAEVSAPMVLDRAGRAGCRPDPAAGGQSLVSGLAAARKATGGVGSFLPPVEQARAREKEVTTAYGDYVMARAPGMTPPVGLRPPIDQEVLVKTA